MAQSLSKPANAPTVQSKLYSSPVNQTVQPAPASSHGGGAGLSINENQNYQN